MAKDKDKPEQHLFQPGNELWKLRKKIGDDREFETPEKMLEECYKYFQWADENPLPQEDFVRGGPKAGKKIILFKKRPYTLHALCIHLGVNTVYFNQFEARIKDKTDEVSLAFAKVITHVREIIYNQKFEGAATGFFNHNIISMELGLTSKKELTHHAKVLPPWMQDGTEEKKE